MRPSNGAWMRWLSTTAEASNTLFHSGTLVVPLSPYGVGCLDLRQKFVNTRNQPVTVHPAGSFYLKIPLFASLLSAVLLYLNPNKHRPYIRPYGALEPHRSQDVSRPVLVPSQVPAPDLGRAALDSPPLDAQLGQGIAYCLLNLAFWCAHSPPVLELH